MRENKTNEKNENLIFFWLKLTPESREEALSLSPPPSHPGQTPQKNAEERKREKIQNLFISHFLALATGHRRRSEPSLGPLGRLGRAPAGGPRRSLLGARLLRLLLHLADRGLPRRLASLGLLGAPLVDDLERGADDGAGSGLGRRAALLASNRGVEVLLVILAVGGGPGDLGGLLALGEEGLGLAVDEEELLC